MNRIDGVSFEEAWATRTVAQLQTERGKVPLNYLSLDLLIRNKEAVARPKDIEDLQYLHRAKRPGKRSV